MKRIIIDSTRCDGCGKCVDACKSHFPDHLSRVLIRTDPRGRFVPLICRQCPWPSCMQGCMSGAITRDADSGILRYRADICAGCYMCVMNCPYGIPYPTEDGHVARCDFCSGEDRPQCVAACEKHAIYLEEG